MAKRRSPVSEGRRAPPAGDSSIPLDDVQVVLNGLADAVIVTDGGGRLQLFNRAADRLLPLGMMEIPLSEWSAYGGFLGPDMQTPLPADELPPLRALQGEVVDDAEIYLPGTRGPEGRWISVSSRPMMDGRGRIKGSVTTVRDITARKQQLERHHLLSNIVEETADAVLVTNSLGHIVYVNAAFERTTGFKRADVLGENPRMLKSGMHSRNFYEDLWTRLLRGEVYRGTLIDRRKSGEVYLSSQTITPLRTPDGAISHMVSIARDLTGRRDDADRGDDLRLAQSVASQLFPTPPGRDDDSDA